MKNIIDFTKKEIGATLNGLHFVKECPKCGKNGEYAVSTRGKYKGHWRCFHKGYVRMGFITITESCEGVQP